ncbi:MAG: tandem-95 repeat protein, partial [Magnetospirillum sp.]|nr:tandem-95 repeat protein [Magnetospirillum sp.]
FAGDLNVSVTAISTEGTTTASASASTTVHDDLTNHGPTVAANASYNDTTNTVLSGTISASDVDGDHLSYSLGTGTGGPQHGAVVLNPDGTFTYTPTSNFTGSDSFKVVVSDGHGGTTTETVSVNVANPNHGPVAGDDSRIDNVAQGPALSVSLGTATTTSTAPTYDFTVSGVADITPTTTVNVAGGAAVTGTAGVDQIHVTGSTGVQMSLGDGNDNLKIDGSTWSGGQIDAGSGNDAVRVTGDTNAQVDMGDGNDALQIGGSNNSGAINAGSGDDTVKIGGASNTAIDLGSGNDALDIGGSNNAAITAGSGDDRVKLGGAANAAIDLGDGNDDLLVNGANNASITAGIGDDSVLVKGDGNAAINLGDGNDQLEVQGAANASISGGSGNDYVHVTGSSNASISGGDGSDVIRVDGNVNSSSISGGGGNDSVFVGGRMWGYADGGSGTDSIELGSYSRADWDANKDSIRSHVTNFENIKFSDGSVMGDSTAFNTGTTTYKTPLTVQATLNDRDGSETLSPVTIGNMPAGGHLELNGQSLTPNTDGTYTVNVSSGTPLTLTLVTSSPVSASNLALTTTVSSTEAHGGDVSATTLVGVGSNAGQTIADEAIHTNEDRALSIKAADLLANDTDADGDKLSITAVGNAAHGSVTLGSDGQITFTPDANFHGTATFDYTVSDGHGGTDIATVTMRVDSVNDAPVFDTAHTTAAMAIDYGHTHTSTGQVTATDVDGDNLTYALVDTGSHHGSLALDANTGAFTYNTDDTSWSGTDTFSVQANDGHGGIATQTISVQVSGDSHAGHAIGWGDGGGRTESWGDRGSWSIGGSGASTDHQITTTTDSHWGSSWQAWDSGNPDQVGTGDRFSISGYNQHSHAIAGGANDTLIGADGNDYISLDDGAGHQMMNGITHVQLGDGNAVLDMTTPNFTYTTDMTVAGGSGHDVIWTAGGDDLITAGNGTTTIHAGAGDDTIVAGAGDDTLLGQNGNDTFLFDFGHGHDVVDGGAGSTWTDTIDLSTNMHAGATITITTADHQSWTVASDGDHAAQNTVNLGHDKSGDITIHSTQGDETVHFTNIETIKY